MSVPAEDLPEILPAEKIVDVFPPLGANIKVLMVWPRFPSSFWGFEGVLRMLPEAAMTPPLGLITVAALCPPSWSLRYEKIGFWGVIILLLLLRYGGDLFSIWMWPAEALTRVLLAIVQPLLMPGAQGAIP